MARKYTGNIPADGKLIAVNGEWELYERTPKGTWRNYQLRSTTPQVKKANYHLGWNGRLARTRDATTLLEHLPDLHAWVVKVTEGNAHV